MRQKLGLSPTSFGRQVDPPLGGSQILDIEEGRRGMTVETLLRICNHYDLTPAEFFRTGKRRAGARR
jgi:transcriptional regulator with XRE-family HTH domain